MSPSTKQAFCFDLPYDPHLFQILACYLSPLPWTMLLHSGQSNHPDSRFNILVSHPAITLVTNLIPIDTTVVQQIKQEVQLNTLQDKDKSKIDLQVEPITTITYYERDEDYLAPLNSKSNTHSSSEDHHGDPFDILQKVMTKLNWQAHFSENMPFQGGALGLFGYDLARTQECIANQAKKLDALPAMAVGVYDMAWIEDKEQQTFQCIIQAISYEQAVMRFNALKVKVDGLSRLPITDDFKLTEPFQSTITQDIYQKQFNQIQSALNAGDCYQVNLTQAFKAKYSGSLWRAFLDLLHANQAPFSAYCSVPGGVVLSASPERFLKVEKGQISTKPIKGTMPRDQCAKADGENKQILFESEKNRAENVMIVDLLRNDIGKIAKPGSVQVPKLFDIESFPAVHHLVSTITAQLPDYMHAVELLKACFPGGSITGAPKVSAMQLIESLEPIQRSIYCGSIGYISTCGRMDSNIAIRTLIATSEFESETSMSSESLVEAYESINPNAQTGELLCFAGGGIVLDSDERDEYAEVYAKLGKILSLWKSIS